LIYRSQTICTFGALALCWGLCACTLGFDTSEVTFGDPQLTEPTSEPDVVLDFVEGLAGSCGIDTGQFCIPESNDWPSCADAQCAALGPDARCVLGSSLFGFCSVECTSDTQCRANTDGFAETMRCVTNSRGEGFCLPGSQQTCASDESCPEGESCKVGMTMGEGGLERRIVCQTSTLRGVERGQHCNDDPRRADGGLVTLCANDLCQDDICSSVCEEGSDASYCGNPNLNCQQPEDPSAAQTCTHTACLSPSECSGFGQERAFCRSQRREGPGQVLGSCRTDNPASEGSRPLGESCVGLDDDGDARRCASRMCVGRAPFFYCSSMCERDDDCGQDMVCSISRFSDDFGTHFLKSCAYARGSQDRCDDGLRCRESGEVCAPVLRGDVSDDGRQLVDASAQAICMRPIPGGVAVGRACEESACLAPGACVAMESDVSICTTVCNNFLDCPDLNECRQVAILGADEHQNGRGVTLRFCIPLF